jgi:ElaB/YqjD/DUF883 family membrane-anchored ribosome-binding protein
MPTQESTHATNVSEQRVTQEFNRFLADIDQLMNSARQLTGDSATLVRHRIEDKVAQARVRLEAMRSVAAKQSDGEQQSQRPWWMNRSVQIVGVAALAGALVASVLLARRSRR